MRWLPWVYACCFYPCAAAQCANSACKAIHKIVDNLNLIEEINYKEEDEKRRKEEEEKEKKGRAAGA